MKPLSILTFISLCIGCAATKTVATKPGVLNGIWIPVKQEIAGKDLPASVFEKDTLTIRDSNYTYTRHDKGVISYSNDTMDIYGREGINAGKHFTAIYKLESNQLTICYNLSGDSYPTAFETKTKPTLFLAIFKKAGK